MAEMDKTGNEICICINTTLVPQKSAINCSFCISLEHLLHYQGTLKIWSIYSSFPQRIEEEFQIFPHKQQVGILVYIKPSMHEFSWLTRPDTDKNYLYFSDSRRKNWNFFLIKPWLQVTFKQLAEAVVSH